VYKRGGSHEITIPQALLLTLEPEKKHQVVFRYAPDEKKFLAYVERTSLSENMKVLELLKVKKKYHREQKKLTEILRRERTISFEGDDEFFLSREIELKYSDYRKKSNLRTGTNGFTKVDFDLFIRGAVLSRTRGPTAIISNDVAIMGLWAKFLKNEKKTPEDFGYYFRKDFINFEKLVFR